MRHPLFCPCYSLLLFLKVLPFPVYRKKRLPI